MMVTACSCYSKIHVRFFGLKMTPFGPNFSGILLFFFKFSTLEVKCERLRRENDVASVPKWDVFDRGRKPPSYKPIFSTVFDDHLILWVHHFCQDPPYEYTYHDRKTDIFSQLQQVYPFFSSVLNVISHNLITCSYNNNVIGTVFIQVNWFSLILSNAISLVQLCGINLAEKKTEDSSINCYKYLRFAVSGQNNDYGKPHTKRLRPYITKCSVLLRS